MATVTTPDATLDDLARVSGKAELIAGRIVSSMPSGFAPSQAALRIVVSLFQHAKDTGVGVANADGIGYAIRPALASGRQSFSPDASYYVGPLPKNKMRFIDGPPTLAVEVRSEGDYGSAAEANQAAKRADYFAAGTQVVWDVDPLARTIAVYRANASQPATVFHPGQTADAEPAVRGWRIAVDEVFG